MLSTSYVASKQPKNYIENMALTASQVLQIYLEYSHPKLNHDIETLMMALIAKRVNSITI